MPAVAEIFVCCDDVLCLSQAILERIYKSDEVTWIVLFIVPVDIVPVE